MLIEGPQLHEGQAAVIDLIQAGKKYVVVCGSRQTGKSFLSQSIMLYWALNNPGVTILCAAPTYSQVKRPLEEISDGLQGSNVIKSVNRSGFEIKFMNGSKILFRSVERPDNLRGLTCDYAVLDEFAYMPDSVWNAVIKPILLVKGKQVLFISTPRGKNLFYDLFQLGQNPENESYASVKMTYESNPFVDIKEIEEAKLTLPDHIFRAEYLAEFTDSGQTVFQKLEECSVNAWPKAEGKRYAGLDLGRANDYTVLTIMDEKGKVLEIYRENLRDWSYMIDAVLQVVQKHDASLLVEVNGLGDVVYESLKKRWSKTQPFITSNRSKQDIIENLALDFNNQAITIPSKQLFAPLTFELEIFTYTYSPKSRSIVYSAPNGQHDDTVMSLAICNQNRKTNRTRGQYTVGGIKL
jgi:PBSX family phage terminase large subunit